MKAFYFTFLLLFCFTGGYSQSINDRVKTYLARKQAHKDSVIAAGRPYLSVLAGPGYSPENGLLIGGGLLYSFSTNPSSKTLQRSTAPINLFYSTKGNVGISTKLKSFWMEDRLRLNMYLNANDGTDEYFGVGIQNAESKTSGDSTTRYKRRIYTVNPEVQVQIIDKVFLGMAFNYTYQKSRDENPMMLEDPNYLKYGNTIRTSGVFFSAAYDSRDVIVNAFSGFFAKFEYGNYGDFLGGKEKFQSHSLDLRKYIMLSKKIRVLAMRIYGRYALGDVPYSEMTMIGGSSDLRGYILGQYRDKLGMTFVSEYRHKFYDRQGDPTKHGMTLWLGTGTVAPDFENIAHLIPNFGVGYRLEVQPRMNVRFDFGVGKHTTGLYFNFTEAF
ncbi:BamA/TamA family outer membrane protein [Algoriphagus chordae]|uniref:Surface antigen-like protein n=1 Tax=Algoriphagus chordae TaxID=237019 RepID=A0A2W7STL6_9BACT|nr:BamA/TamA family outer membrane protein [Algoriphagus chordae]PZX54062.1 surface antigen-like protein [Algoriphagus chordae]